MYNILNFEMCRIFMNWIEQHKALLITMLITGIIVFGLFSLQITKQNLQDIEKFYAVTTKFEDLEEEKEVETEESNDLNNTKATNKAYNEDEVFEELMKNLKTLRPNDFELTTKTLQQTNKKHLKEKNASTNNNAVALINDAEATYKKLQDQLYNRLENKTQADEHSKTKSTLTYSLKDRMLTHYNTPRYLCEFGGKIVVNINVNASGSVLEAYINNASSSSNNQCLIDNALDYAKSARFNASNRASQLGTITFLFKGKL